MATKINVFLSDLHIGTSAESNWFQKDVHTRLIKSVIEYILQNSRQVNDVVLLGDWFELWNYPPNSTVPSLEEIFARNPELFARTSDEKNFISLMEGIDGSLRFVNGDHDMLVRVKDLNELFARHTDCRVMPGHGNLAEKDPLANTYYSSGRIWAEHGNQHDLFSRPSVDEKNLSRPYPLGYFLNRLFCFYVEKKIASLHRRDAACLSDCHSPGEQCLGMKMFDFFDQIIEKILKKQKVNAAEILFENVMARNRSIDIEFNMRTEGFGDLEGGKIVDYFADMIESNNVFASFAESDVALYGLGKCAQRHFRENPNARVVIMGHTHCARMELMGTGRPCIYVNSGFLCPSVKDMETGRLLPSFSVVTEHPDGGIEVGQKLIDGKDSTIVDGISMLINCA